MSNKREAVVQKISGNIARWNAAKERIHSQGYPARLEAQAQYRRTVEKLQSERQAIEDWIDQLQRSDRKALVGVKAGLEMAWKALSR